MNILYIPCGSKLLQDSMPGNKLMYIPSFQDIIIIITKKEKGIALLSQTHDHEQTVYSVLLNCMIMNYDIAIVTLPWRYLTMLTYYV